MKLASALVALCLPSFAIAQGAVPPPAPVRPVTETYHGDAVVDPYRWLEDHESPEAREWARAQDAWARKALSALPAREHYLKRLAELEAIKVEELSYYGSLAPVLQKDGRIFLAKRRSGEPQPRLYVRSGAAGPERPLFDPAAGRAAGAPPRSLAWFVPSPTGKHVAIGVAEGGSERSDLFVLEVATGKVVDGPIPRTDYAQPSWTPDGKGFFYTQFAAGKKEADRYLDAQSRYRRLGSGTEADPVVFGNALPASKHIDPLHVPYVFADPDGKLLYGMVNRGTERAYALYTATMADFRAGKLAWTPLFGFDTGFEVPEPDQFPPLARRNGELLLLTRKGNPDGNIVALDPLQPNRARVVYKAKDAPITYFTQAKDGMYLRLQDGPVGRVVRLDPRTGAVTPIALPLEGRADFAQHAPGADGLLVLAGSYTTPSQWQLVAKGARRAQPLPLNESSALLAVANLASEVAFVTSHDGVKVPMSILYPKSGFKKDGTARAYVNAYAGYGLVDTPYFSRNFVALAERGFVVAICHARGSGAYGERWHKAGFKATKPNTWKDMIACAEHLAKDGWASPKRLSGTGGSAGGIAIGRAITEKPEVFAAAVIRVGALDTLRFETTANGKTNTVELGSVANAAEYPGLKAMSTYHAITDGTKYPAVLLTHGFNDPRVPVWASTKAGARFQAATTSGKPVYLRIDMDAGHGVGSSTSQRNAENADVFAFLEASLP